MCIRDRYKNLGGTFVRFVTIHACDGETDRQTDVITITKTTLAYNAAR